MAEMVATVAVKTALVCAAGMFAVAGTLTLGFALERATLAPEGAGADNVTVQLAVPGAATVAGVQLTDEGTIGTVKPMLADCCCPLAVAVTVTFWAALTAAVVAAKLALVCPAPTVTLCGTVRTGEPLAIATTTALGAAMFSDMEQLLAALLEMLLGLQEIPVSCGTGAVAESVKDCVAPL